MVGVYLGIGARHTTREYRGLGSSHAGEEYHTEGSELVRGECTEAFERAGARERARLQSEPRA